MSELDQEKMQQLQKLANMIQEAEALFQAAAQYAGDNNLPLETVGNYNEVEGIWFAGQPFELKRRWNQTDKSNTYEWYNSNC
jgi:hypothetical protein